MTIEISSGFSKILISVLTAGFLAVNGFGLYFIKLGIGSEIQFAAKDVFVEEWTQKAKPVLDLEIAALRVKDDLHADSIQRLWTVNTERTQALNQMALDLTAIKVAVELQKPKP